MAKTRSASPHHGDAPQRVWAPRGDGGSTLIEVVIATVILGIMAAAVLGILFTAQASSRDSRNRVAASNLAAREIDLVRQVFGATDTGPLEIANAGLVTNPNQFPYGVAGQPLVVDGTPYTVIRSVAWNITGTGESACEGGIAVEHPTLIVTVSVSWPRMGTTKPVVNTASLAPERGLGLPTTASFVAVMVKDSTGAPSPGRTVTVSSPSETITGSTDPSGCAVLAVFPPAAGAEYVARFPDVGYVDITGTTNPERSIGRVMQQQLLANVEIALDQAASVVIRMTGSGLTAADVAGTTVSLYQSEASGSSVTQHVVSGIDTLVPNLWPTQYAAFFGTEVPGTFTNLINLPPGGSAILEVPFEFAEFNVTDLPAPGTVIAAAPGGSCTTPGARTIDPAGDRLPPGTWSFFLSSPDFGCSNGPADVSLQPGPNGAVAWAETSLTVLGAPTGQGAIWAVSNRVSASSCSTTNAIKLADDGGTVGPIELPSGDWYVYAMADSGGVPAGGACRDAGLVAVPYGQVTTHSWTPISSTVTVIGAPTGSYLVIATGSPATTCTRWVVGDPYGQFTETGSGHVRTLTQGTWYLYSWDTTYYGDPNRCSGGYPITIGWEPSYTMTWSDGAVTTP
jgi:type II secretory pathway pseudopilin PulG